MMGTRNKMLATLLTAALSVSFTPAVASTEGPALSMAAQKNGSTISVDKQAEEFATAFAFVDDIPDEVLENSTDDEIVEYIRTMEIRPTASPRMAAASVDPLWCAASISSAIAGAAFPAFKLAKIVRIVKKLGGPRKTAEKIKEMGGLGKVAGKHANENTTTGMLASLAAELTGIAGIRDYCF
ncbi:hypothetical protein HMPREF3048_00125 [Corynebacterium sp. HMSC075D04]|uniref:hypothetical protein n=1 Tax=unclassified Corynebacterium TaxID=2624378 RepID=UPI0008A40202|nr:MULTISPECIES: hypothetical protein [unclassified Corynebacterium]OFO37202.1 hypothetical protein HMPREF3048_00125 [Corynebacterium sp. HMSC075D04]OHO34542.1 hypothetical protein HMPREF2656_04430 [Corynebacterium sp. HMSC034B08]